VAGRVPARASSHGNPGKNGFHGIGIPLSACAKRGHERSNPTLSATFLRQLTGFW
jgi:hypothetical protein